MKLKIGTKLAFGFGVVLVLMIITGVLSYWRISDAQKIEDYILQIRIPSIERSKDLQNNLNYVASKTRQAILAGGQPGRREDAKKLCDTAWGNIEKDFGDLEKLAPHWVLQENRDRLPRAKEQISRYKQISDEVIELSAGRGEAIIKAGDEYSDKAIPVNDQIKQSLGALVDSQLKLLDGEREKIASANTSIYWTLVLTTTIALVAGITLAIFLSRKISGAATSVLQQAEAIAAGDLTGEDVKVVSQDELGDLTAAVNKMQASMRSMIESIANAAQQLGNASEEVSTTTQQISANSQETSAQAGVVSAATEEVSRNLQTVATATEEMSASIQEIAKNATEAAKVAAEAMKTATETNTIVSKLGDSSAEIGQVIKVITSIAQKTDLLALNATVEAARAGEVGAGFAVVANEVKELAKQTASATEDISKKIEAIQVDAKGAVQAIKTISGIVDQVNAISATIATAVEEQSATTSEMSRNLTEAAKGSGEVAQNIHGVAQAAESTSQGVTGTQQAAQQLVELSAMLRQLVGQFKTGGNGHGSGVRRGAATAASVSLDFAGVKAAHRSWRLKLRGFLDGRENLTTGKLASHRDCDLGKWLYGAGGATYGQIAEFQQLEEKHKEMHAMVNQVVELKHAGRAAEAEQGFQGVCRAADQVVALLSKVEAQVARRVA